jgi:hypothetical protein
MVADPAFLETFVDWCGREIAERQAELAPLEAGTVSAGQRLHGGSWEDVSHSRVQQIKREIASLENAIVQHKHYWKQRCPS